MNYYISARGSVSSEFLNMLGERKEYIQNFISVMKKDNIDVILAPGFVMTAPEHDLPTKTLRKIFFK